jgi:hypothetical protein
MSFADIVSHRRCHSVDGFDANYDRSRRDLETPAAVARKFADGLGIEPGRELGTCPMGASQSDRTVPMLASPKRSCEDVHTRPALQKMLAFGSVKLDLGHRTAALSRRERLRNG